MGSEPEPPAESEPVIESDDVIPVPSKGYNLDFLDQLDDPNFNPFETKTSVVNNFDENQPITEASELSQENENIVKVINVKNNSEEKTETRKEEKKEEKREKTKEDKKPKKAQPPKPWLKKGPKKKAHEETPDAEKEEEIVVPSKGYNFDILGKLDDPNFNPFETKNSVVNNFETTDIKNVSENHLESEQNFENVESIKDAASSQPEDQTRCENIEKVPEICDTQST